MTKILPSPKFPDNTWEFDQETVCTLTSPGIYIYWKGNEAMYVGCTKQGLLRVFSIRAHKFEPRSCDKITFTPLASFEDARKQEAQLILELRPQYNSNWPQISLKNGSAEKKELTGKTAVENKGVAKTAPQEPIRAPEGRRDVS